MPESAQMNAHQPTEASARESVSITSTCSMAVISGPPQILGMFIRMIPASRISSTMSGGRLRSSS